MTWKWSPGCTEITLFELRRAFKSSGRKTSSSPPHLHSQVGGFSYLHFTRSVALAAVLYKKKMFPVEN